MSAAKLIAKLQQQRDSWCVLREADGDAPELAVCLRRPPEAELPELRLSNDKPMHKLLGEAVCTHAVDWRGVTEADLLGSAVGSSDPVPFSAELWAEVVRDRSDWLGACAAHLMQAIAEHMRAREEQRKN